MPSYIARPLGIPLSALGVANEMVGNVLQAEAWKIL